MHDDVDTPQSHMALTHPLSFWACLFTGAKERERERNELSAFVSFEPYLHLKIMGQYEDGAVTFTFIFNQFQ